MKQLFQNIINFFSRKSPCCNSLMENIGEHKGSLVYECNECGEKWF